MNGKAPAPAQAEPFLPIDFLIVGGGIAGLTTAIALKRVGHRVVVLEKDTEGSEKVTAGSRLPPNLSKILYHWGLEKEVFESVAIASECIQFFIYETGEYIGTHMWNEELLREARGQFLFAQHSDLQRFLYDTAISYGAKIRRGAHVVDIDAHNRTVRLATGQVLRADVIICADGLTSIARRQFLAKDGISDDDATSIGLTMYNTTAPKDLIMADPELRGFYEQKYLPHYFWYGDGYCALGYPTGGNGDFALSLYSPQDSTDLPWGEGVPPSKMLEKLGQCEPRLRKLVRMARPASVRSCKDWKVPEDWVHESGRMLIVGEAAHPFVPTGVQSIAMAVEDGAVLAKLFFHLKRRDQIESFLWAFQDLRRDRVISLMHSEQLNLLYMAQPASEATEARNQGYRDKHAAGINALDNADEHTEELWAQILRIFGYDAEDEADNWWVEWGLLRERAKGVTALGSLDYDLIVQSNLDQPNLAQTPTA